ncbi:protein ENHANCED DOWNY MILDEW 2 isoform X2 [Cicer arietinum]|uniref:protein ENHANCED DOWNY MILDEW 2 isoform X2 n=1 Tax=Cicer arietinum TaxID=3827 RepID=UPI003CC6AD05
MASSDDESDTQPLSVSNYHFEDDKDAPVSFSVLPIRWSESESVGCKKGKVFLHGNADNGLQKIFMQVIAWRFDLSNVKPEISVLSKDGRWIKLQKPRKSYEDTIRTILITVYFLHYLKKNPDPSARSVWDSLSKNKEFSYYEVKPSLNDLSNHMGLMGEAATRDAVLAKSKLLLTVLEDKDRMKIKKLSEEEVKELARPGFIIDDTDNGTIDETVEESDEEDELFDSVCSICDNGGELLCCDGKCMRSFHANEEDGEESSCVSLGFSRKEVQDIQNFYCKNCEYNQHQCFACGVLGCSDKFTGAEVFKCASATCGFFYHPQCVAKLLHRVVESVPMELARNISKGEPFTCPAHYCCICKEMENRQEHELQFAVCRRCPKSYHRKCLPRKIAFEDIVDENIVTRAWEDLLPNNRILIYCLKHEIDDELGTPIRDHIKFPNVKGTVREINTEEKIKPSTKEVISNKNNGNLPIKRTSAKLSDKMSYGKVGIKNSGKISGSNIPRKKANEAPRRYLNENKRSVSKETERSDYEENQLSLGVQLYDLYQKGSEQVNSGNQVDNVADNTLSIQRTKKLSSAAPQLDADSERRLLALFKEATSSVTLENVIKEHKFASTHTHSLKNVVEKTITAGKLEGSVEAVRTAIRMLEDGHSIREAEAVCGPNVLNQIFKWKDKLKVYLAPVLYGNRYTSYGRHFTQVEKLEGIVDFCCGANDFSTLMKKKLEEMGKRCSYKNFDLLPTKNDFNFEMRDWMTVQRKELPSGSRLIMGLNPPFGVKAALANKFIDKALEFEPKLLILIVPPETQRLDKKRSPYNLVWEDERFLSGKSFYLPGSVDANDKQMEQWNVKPPPLYLWSRPDWADKHKQIAQEHGHLFRQPDVSKVVSIDKEKSPSSHTMDEDYVDDIMLDRMLDRDFLKSNNNEDYPFMESKLKGMSSGNVDRESQERQEYLVTKVENTSWKRKENDGRGPAVISPAKRQDISEIHKGVRHHGTSSPLDVEGYQPDIDMLISPDRDAGDIEYTSLEPHSSAGGDGYRHVEPLPSSLMEFGEAYDAPQSWPNVSDPLPDYRLKDLQEHNSRLLGDSAGNLRYRPYPREDDSYLRELETRKQVHPHGLQPPESMSSYLSGHDPAYNQIGSTYSVLGSGSELSYMTSTPAMQRYAPRLDDLNHVRTNSLGPERPIVGGSDAFERSIPQPGYGNVQPGFAAGPPQLYPRHNSSNWSRD